MRIKEGASVPVCVLEYLLGIILAFEVGIGATFTFIPPLEIKT